MTDRPILFSAPMVRAILSGTKTQTRRAVKGWPLEWLAPGMFTPEYVADPANAACPYGVPGDQLWVREAWAAPHAYDHVPPRLTPPDARFHYLASEERGGLLGRPSIHMPRWASRITLNVTGVRVERLQAISEADADAECFGGNYPGEVLPELFPGSPDRWGHLSIPECFRKLWESINGAESWDANPWVWVVEFERAEA
jgi:hypothetical protein